MDPDPSPFAPTLLDPPEFDALELLVELADFDPVDEERFLVVLETDFPDAALEAAGLACDAFGGTVGAEIGAVFGVGEGAAALGMAGPTWAWAEVGATDNPNNERAKTPDAVSAAPKAARCAKPDRKGERAATCLESDS